MSTPAFFKRLEASKKRRAGWVDHSLSKQQQQQNFGMGSMTGAMAQPSWRQEPTWTMGGGYMDFSDDSVALSNSIGMGRMDGGNATNGFFSGGQFNAYANPQLSMNRSQHNRTNSKRTRDDPVFNPEPVEYHISPDNITCFFGKRHFLSTLYQCRMTIEGYAYPSVEHYYQACKLYTLGGSQLALHMSRVADPAQCKSTAKTLLRGVADKRKVDDWKNQEAPEVLLHALLHKFDQNAQLRQQLLATGDTILVHSFDRDTVYANGMNEADTKKWANDHKRENIKIPRNYDKGSLAKLEGVPLIGKGHNLLGVLHMMVREAFRPERGRCDPKIVSMLTAIRGGSSGGY